MFEQAESDGLLNPSFINKFRNAKEQLERGILSESSDYNYLYPNLNDPNFNIKLSEKKEFYDNQYDGTIEDIKTKSDILCNALI